MGPSLLTQYFQVFQSLFQNKYKCKKYCKQFIVLTDLSLIPLICQMTRSFSIIFANDITTLQKGRCLHVAELVCMYSVQNV